MPSSALMKDCKASPTTLLFNGRDTLVDEIKSVPELANVLAEKFKRYLGADDLDTAVEGFVMTEDNSEARKRRILDAFRRVAGPA